MTPELIPAIDLRNGKVVRLRRGDYNQQTTYEVDPIDTAKRFEEAGCKWLHVVDLDGAKEGRPVNLAMVEKIIHATGLHVEVGGGIRTEEAMEYVLAIGAQRIILGTRALADMEWFEGMARDPRFRQRLVLGLDARDGLVSTHGWTHTAEDLPKATDLARQVDGWPLAAIIYTDIARDGMMKGPNVKATAVLAKLCKNVPIVHSGGVTTLKDITALKRLPIAGIIVGKAIYEGTLEVGEAVRELATAGAEGEDGAVSDGG
ncbi:MAG TPA: 1-(5-phosphoribosyl)-5-[(5-phosphoribosylamino)methylideneamino]imidazole-4-carboxamide isomerase [Phycisphaerae bacterium]|nr:1-(5-phosphoribosyl)-5-[(5-phosphoribosylamino)methylideneamino]imidazole-4-carboxamide isomerase [Phycisphaerae bacterium]